MLTARNKFVRNAITTQSEGIAVVHWVGQERLVLVQPSAYPDRVFGEPPSGDGVIPAYCPIARFRGRRRGFVFGDRPACLCVIARSQGGFGLGEGAGEGLLLG